MKKLLMFGIILLLAGCKPTEQTPEQVMELEFDGETYSYSDTTSDGYDQFSGNGHMIEIQCEDTCILSFELDSDIYIIIGTSDTYEITRNGSIILIDGENQTPTGTEIPDWNEDILNILKAYKK